MNTPGRAGGNWRWRYTDEMLTDKPFARLRDLTANSKRLPDAETVVAGESGGNRSHMVESLATGALVAGFTRGPHDASLIEYRRRTV
jgi:hypothetical protein